MRNFIKATGTKTLDFGNGRVRVIVTGNDKLRAYVLPRHLMQWHAYRLPAGLLVALERFTRPADRAAVSWFERVSSIVSKPLAARQPVCSVPCSSSVAG